MMVTRPDLHFGEGLLQAMAVIGVSQARDESCVSQTRHLR